jgi:hypothetical protein
MKTKKNKLTIKKNGGADANVPKAAIELIMEGIGLSSSIFKAVGGIMSMPSDMARAVPKNIANNEPAQVNQPAPAKLPTNELNSERSRIKGK